MPRPPEPEYLIQWRQIRLATNAIPRCCHTCENFDSEGKCSQFGETPPTDYIDYGSKDCEAYNDEIPF